MMVGEWLLEPQLDEKTGGNLRITAKEQMEEHYQNQRSGARRQLQVFPKGSVCGQTALRGLFVTSSQA